jgi:ribosomal protein L11 methyltransferase
MFSLRVPNEANLDRDILIADLWEAGATGITEEPDAVRAFFEGPAEPVLALFAPLQATVHEEDTRDWVRFAQDQWSSFPVGDRFFLVPEWLDEAAPEGRLRLRMHPGMACGTGTHAATRLCLMAMERHVRPAESVLDVGTGAGILADAATLLGARPVFGCDIEHDATLVARGNLDDSVALFTGSARSVRNEAVDWAVCNLNAATLATLADELNRVSHKLIVSGFREDESAGIARLFQREIREVFELEGYACLVL